jgi:hypothetical protein
MTWNTLDVPLETGWQCTPIPGPRYRSMMWRGYDEMAVRSLYPSAGSGDRPSSWNARPLSEAEKREQWDEDRLRQLADDQADFARHFRPNWDLRSNTGANALREVRAFVCDHMNVVHWISKSRRPKTDASVTGTSRLSSKKVNPQRSAFSCRSFQAVRSCC